MNKTAAATDRSVASLFEPDVLTTHRFFKVFQQKGQLDPEENLMFAVLTDAIECFQKYFGDQSRRCRALVRRSRSMDRKPRLEVAIFLRTYLPGAEYQPELSSAGSDAMALGA